MWWQTFEHRICLPIKIPLWRQGFVVDNYGIFLCSFGFLGINGFFYVFVSKDKKYYIEWMGLHMVFIMVSMSWFPFQYNVTQSGKTLRNWFGRL